MAVYGQRQTMLRITKQKRNDHLLFVLEGRLAGDWVQELVTSTCELGPGTRTVIDIEHVHYVDALGEKALHWLNRVGAGFIAGNTYCVGLCDRLKLRRLTGAERNPQKHKRRNDDLTPSGRSWSPQQRSSKAKGRH
jgi:hypothetical protein